MITVIGSLNIDLIAKVPQPPLAGETKMGSDFHIVPGGKGANQAIACRRSGVQTRMIGCVGQDAFGEISIQSLIDSGVDARHVNSVNESTGTAIIQIDDDGQNRIVIIPGANALVTKDMIDVIWPEVQGSTYLLLQNEIPAETNAHILNLAQQAGMTTVLNAAPYVPLDDEVLAKVDILVVNETEAAMLSGIEAVDIPSAWEATGALHARGARCVITTLGQNGSLYSDGQSRWYQPAIKTKAVDTTAAGDTFVGAFVAARQANLPVDGALRFATTAASVAVSRLGAQPSIPGRDEILALLPGCPDPVATAV